MGERGGPRSPRLGAWSRLVEHGDGRPCPPGALLVFCVEGAGNRDGIPVLRQGSQSSGLLGV